LMDEVMAGPPAKEEREGALAGEYAMLAQAKKIALFTAGAAMQKYMQKMADEEEVMGALADIIIQIYAMESGLLRAAKIESSKAENAVAMARVYAARAMETIESSAKRVIAMVAEGDSFRTQMTILRRLVKHDPANTIALKRVVAAKVIVANGYVV